MGRKRTGDGGGEAELLPDFPAPDVRSGAAKTAAGGQVEALVRIAAGYQFREAGVVEHLRRVYAYVDLLAGALGLAAHKARLLAHAALLHDIGMIDVPEAIVKKEGALGDEEFNLLKRHTQLGHALLSESGVPLLELGSALALTHHEHFDGTGYPNGLEGTGIPQGARILAAADILDALTTHRPYKEAYPFDVAFEIIESMAGRHLDPKVVAALLGRRAGLEGAGKRLATVSRPTKIGFRISARDRSLGELFSITRQSYFSCPYCKELHPKFVDMCPQRKLPLKEIHKLSGIVLDGKYRLGGALGAGGMGTIYEAQHILIGRRLAVKFLDPGLASDQGSLTRFYNEARVSSAVKNPNLVEVTDMGRTADGIPYIVMEFLEGTDLSIVVFEQGRLAPIAAATLALEVLRTLGAVHEAGIVHRDLKPENIFILRDPARTRIKILDFGISHLVPKGEAAVRLTQQGIVFGTPQYMSPEQAQGKAEIDSRSDIFTMGSILFEMLTGQEVFKGRNNLEIVSAVVMGTIRRPRELAADCPPELERVVMRALERDPGKRWQTAGEFAAQLEEFASKDPRFREGLILDLWREPPPEEVPTPMEEPVESAPQRRTDPQWLGGKRRSGSRRSKTAGDRQPPRRFAPPPRRGGSRLPLRGSDCWKKPSR